MKVEEFDKLLKECAYKDLKNCSEEELKVLAIEKARCQSSLFYFFKYCRLQDAPTPGNLGGIVPFKMWDHTKILLVALLTKRLISVLKSRQIGASWTIALFVLWYAMAKNSANILLFSKGKTEAIELLGKVKRIYLALPPFLRLKLDPDSALELGFPSMRSSIKAFAATETAGISFTSSIVVCDEWIEHPFAEENFLSSKPTIDAGGQFIGIFTINKQKLATMPVTIYKDGRKGINGFTSLFFGWRSRPERTEEWYDATKRSIPVTELGTLSPDVYMAQNYPGSDAEALAPEQSIAAFDLKSIDWMMGETRNPITIDNPGIDSKIIHVYKPYNIGSYYIAATDTSHGVGRDYSVTLVLNVKTGEVVADICHNVIPPEELAFHSVKMLELYQSPLWFPEDNEWGRVVINTAQQLGYKNFGYQDKEHTRPGYKTLGGETGRDLLWGTLIPAINNRQIVVYNKDGLSQFYDLIRIADKNGRIEAQANRHDDYPMALAIAWLKRGEVTTEKWAGAPINTLHFESNGKRVKYGK